MVDVDSFLGEVCGRLKQGAAYGYTHLLGYHSILATRADTRETLHIRIRKGSANTQRGIRRLTNELIARVERAGASGVKLLRADSGFWNTKVFARLEAAGWQYSIGARMIKTVQAAVEAIDEHAWQTIDYPDDGEAQIPETVHCGRRLIVRRTRLLGAQAELWPDWRHFALITNRSDEIETVEADHRDHAVVEQVIVDLKDQALAHFPSGQFNANAAWTALGALAHNLLRWTRLLGLPDTVRAAPHTAPPPARHRRPPDPPRPRLAASPPGPLALAGAYINALNRMARCPPPPDRGTRTPTPSSHHPRIRDHRCPRTPQTASAEAPNHPPPADEAADRARARPRRPPCSGLTVTQPLDR